MTVLNITFPIFAIAVLGYVLTRSGMFAPTHIAGISRYVFTFAIPILLFNTASNIIFAEQIHWSFLFVYFGVALSTFAIGNLMGRYIFGLKPAGHAIVGLAIAYSNTVLVGIPVISVSLGDEALVPLFLILSLHSPILFTLTTIVAESESDKKLTGLQIVAMPLSKIFRNPIILGLFSGLIFNWTGLSLPTPIESTIQMIRGSAIPCALFVLGASMSQYKLSGAIGKAALIVAGKMLLMPVVVYLLTFHLLNMEPLWATVAVLLAGMPVGINAAIFAQQYDAAVAPTNTAVLLSTVIAMVSIPLTLALLVQTP